MGAIMVRDGFNLPPSLAEAQAPLQIGDSLRAWLKATGTLLCAVFDWLGERRQRAYERRLFDSLDSRARSDLGLGSAAELHQSIDDWWAKR